MDSESIGEVRSALAAFPGLADVTVIEHGPSQDDQCLIAYVVPAGDMDRRLDQMADARK